MKVIYGLLHFVDAFIEFEVIDFEHSSCRWWKMKGEMKMDFGVTSKLWDYGINNHTSAITEKNIDGSFAEIAEHQTGKSYVFEMQVSGV